MTQEKKSLSIEVKVTDRCDMKCYHCVNSDGPTKTTDLDWKLFNRRLEEWALNREQSPYTLQEVRLTGGEPLISFDSILDISRCCRRLGIKTGINTTGLMLNAKRIGRLKESGVELMKISFDSVTRPVYANNKTGKSSFYTLEQAIRDLVRFRFNVILRFTLSRNNLDQLYPCYESAIDLGVSKFQIKPLIRAGRANDLNTFLSPSEVNEALRNMAGKYAGTSLPTEVSCWPADHIDKFSYRNCASIDKIYISTGMLTSICNYIQEDLQIRLGDLSHMSLETILEHRLQIQWAVFINGYHLPKNCPNTKFFLPGPA